jgi:hypothetical protein
MKRVGIYIRVSTDGQTTANQRRELEAVAARSGWEIVGIYEDAGISGAKGRDRRRGFDRLLKDATARKIDMVAAWSVDRLGRSLQHLLGFLNELQALGCDLYLHQQALDTSTPSGRAMFQMCGVCRIRAIDDCRTGQRRIEASQGARRQAWPRQSQGRRTERRRGALGYEQGPARKTNPEPPQGRHGHIENRQDARRRHCPGSGNCSPFRAGRVKRRKRGKPA